jgi:hypothetical protein
MNIFIPELYSENHVDDGDSDCLRASIRYSLPSTLQTNETENLKLSLV